MSKELLEQELPRKNVIGFSVNALSFDSQIALMLKWAKARLSRTVCIANVHMLVEANHNSAFASVLQSADLVTPDGMPLVWMLKSLGVPRQDRVAGMDVFLELCKLAPQSGVSIFLLGSQSSILQSMRTRLEKEFPHLEIAGMAPLPFRPLTQIEDEEIIQQVNDSGAGLVLVSLGCPKQEVWMSEHRNRIQAVMIGLGGVFPIYAGIHKRAPEIIRNAGFEWLYRLLQEPRRLWRRYGSTIPVFIWLSCKQLLFDRDNIALQDLDDSLS
jgi:N-acetylglucosaminyldiphosphoundecaprenol N-acetyl-beta-D-mannosaminyltransferase